MLLADGVNLSLKKMADACETHTFWELLRIARWHVREETTAHALAMIVEAQSALPMARCWGAGDTASSDGQHFPAGGMGEAMNVVNARYGHEPGLTAYSHVSDQYAPFVTQVIPATAHEAPYILDGLLQNDAGQRINEHYADTGGFTDHVFAICSILGFRFAPRIRDLPDKRLYAFDPLATHPALQPLIGGRINVRLIRDNWPDILRLAASMATGAVIPSQILRKLAAYPPPKQPGRRAPRGRPRRAPAIHARLAERSRPAAPGPDGPEQGRGAPCAEARHQLQPARRNP